MTHYTYVSRFVLILLALGFVYHAYHADAVPRENPSDYTTVIPWEGWGDFDGVMSGRVIDPEGNPLPYARVRVHSKEIETFADRNGFFTIHGLQRGGHYSLIISADGYETDVARWIPIPLYSTADIGDYHLRDEELRTNIWQITTEVLPDGSSIVVSNMMYIIGTLTSHYSYAHWHNITSDYRSLYPTLFLTNGMDDVSFWLDERGVETPDELSDDARELETNYPQNNGESLTP